MKVELFLKLMKLFLKNKDSLVSIALKENLTYATVAQFYHKNKVPYNLPKPPRQVRRTSLDPKGIRANIKKAYKLYELGKTLQEVGDLYNITRERVRQLFKEYGLPTRSVKLGLARKYFYCQAGHPLFKGETLTKCKKCRALKKELRKKGLHYKTECKYGHPLTPDNLYVYRVDGRKARRCKTCTRKRQADYLRRKQ